MAAAVIASVAYTDPEVAWVSLTKDQAKAQGINVKKATLGESIGMAAEIAHGLYTDVPPVWK